MAVGDHTYRASYSMSIAASDTLEVSETIRHKNEVTLRSNNTLSATTSPPASAVWGDDIELAAGVATIDLTSLTGASMPDSDFSGKKLQLIGIECPETNTDVIKFSPGALDGYNFMGDANDQLTVGPGCSAMIQFNDNLDDVSTTSKNIDVAGTGTDKFNITLVAG